MIDSSKHLVILHIITHKNTAYKIASKVYERCNASGTQAAVTKGTGKGKALSSSRAATDLGICFL